MADDWSCVTKKSGTYHSDEVLRVKPGCNLRVRLLGQPVRMFKAFGPSGRCVTVSRADAEILKQKYPGKVRTTERYACWCIDRATNTPKVLEMPGGVARAMGARAEILGVKIAHAQEGCDWGIGTNDRMGKEVRYHVTCIKETPLTKEEVAMVKELMADKGKWDLLNRYIDAPLAEAEELLL